jgi:hypothetical protein
MVASGRNESNRIARSACAKARRGNGVAAMKLLLSLGAVAAVCLLAQCSNQPPAPGDKDIHGRAQTNAYRDGYHHGFMDGSRMMDFNFERYHDEYKPETKEVFHTGYQKGFSEGRRNASASPADQDRAYQNGYDAGQSDAQNGASPSPDRYRSQFSTGSEASFRDGYAKGYREGRKG